MISIRWKNSMLFVLPSYVKWRLNNAPFIWSWKTSLQNSFFTFLTPLDTNFWINSWSCIPKLLNEMVELTFERDIPSMLEYIQMFDKSIFKLNWIYNRLFSFEQEVRFTVTKILLVKVLKKLWGFDDDNWSISNVLKSSPFELRHWGSFSLQFCKGKWKKLLFTFVYLSIFQKIDSLREYLLYFKCLFLLLFCTFPCNLKLLQRF